MRERERERKDGVKFGKKNSNLALGKKIQLSIKVSCKRFVLFLRGEGAVF